MAKKDFPLDIDLMKNELQNSSFHKLSTPPSNPVVGQFYYDTADSRPYYWNGSIWIDFDPFINDIIESGPQYSNIVIDSVTGKLATEPIYVTLTDVIENTVTTPPTDATAEDAYIIPIGATGVWAGLTNQIAIYNGATWDFYIPQLNDVTTILTGVNAGTVKFDGNDWVEQVVPVLPGWQTAGNTLSATGIFGTISNHDVQIKTNNTFRSILTKDGKWGFGSNTPQAGIEITTDLAFNPVHTSLSSNGTVPVTGMTAMYIDTKDTLSELRGFIENSVRGHYVIVTNKTGSDLTIIEQSLGVTAGWRIITGVGDVLFKNGTAVSFQYDASSQRWRMISVPIEESDPIFTQWLALNPTSGTNTGDQDLTPYLLKDTTLQTVDTPEDTSLFSFWKIGVGRLKIAWSDLLNTISHNQLMGLDWLTSGHTGNANKIFGSDADGLAKEYALTDLGGAKRLELKRTITLGGYTATSIAIRQTSDNIKIAICGTSVTKILTLSLDLKTISHAASVVTYGSLVEYIENIDEFWIIQDTGNLIYRISADTNLLIGTFATSTATVARQNFFYYKGFVYSSALDSTNILRINSLDRSFTVTYLSYYNVRKIIAFEHQGIDYIHASTNYATKAMDMNLNIYPITNIETNELSSIVYLNNKLYLNRDGRSISLDLTNWPITSSCPIKDEVIVFFDQIKDSDNYLLLQRYACGNVLIKTDFSDLISSTNIGLIPRWTTNSYPDVQLKFHSSSQFIFVLNYSTFFYLTIYKYE